MSDDVVSDDTKVSRTVIAYDLCKCANDGKLVLSDRVTNCLVYAAIIIYYSVADLDLLRYLISNSRDLTVVAHRYPLDNMPTIYEKFRYMRNKVFAHVDESHPTFQANEGMQGWFSAPPGLDRLHDAHGGMHIRYTMPFISPQDRLEFIDLAGVTADLYYQAHQNSIPLSVPASESSD